MNIIIINIIIGFIIGLSTSIMNLVVNEFITKIYKNSTMFEKILLSIPILNILILLLVIIKIYSQRKSYKSNYRQDGRFILF